MRAHLPRTLWRWLLTGTMMVAFGACAEGDKGGTPAPPATDCAVDGDCNEGEVCAEGACAPGEMPEDVGDDEDVPPDMTMDASPEVEDERPPQMGETGDPCDDTADCPGGQCIQTSDGRKICTEFCMGDSCPEGFECLFVENSGPDGVFLCFPDVDFLCTPCAVDANCGGFSDRCVSYDHGTFCGQDCLGGDCPSGYDCVQLEDEGGEPVFQCLLENRYCCQVSNEGIEICDGQDNDCNGLIDDGFENSNEVENCGGCGQVCERSNGEVACVSGECQLTGCEEGFFDIDQNPDNGCEYACTFISEQDFPDSAFQDANCDGTDGLPSQAVFVAPEPIGAQGAPGTMAQPVSTINEGMLLASEDESRSYLIVAQGVYTESVTVINGVSIFGGYTVGEHAWTRADALESPTVIGAGAIGINAQNINLPTTIGNVQIVNETPTTFGQSSIALHIVNASDALVIRNNIITASDGANGRDGTEGRNGDPGTRGGDGESGCDGCDGRGTGGTAGMSPCGSNGGAGGRGASGDNTGARGGNGVGAAPGQGGGGGGGDGDTCVFGCDGGGGGNRGGNAGNGGPGGNGAGGDANGFVEGNFWFGSLGVKGGDGVNGSGGGGGGGGGGSSCCRNDRGGGGGGGGGGGCGGAGGGGGQGGGGSFAILLVNASPQIFGNSISVGAGGEGGDGVVGGEGGEGGAFGGGGGPADDGGPGGDGGNGGNGGRGGCGGGGGGGISFAIYRANGSDPRLDVNEFALGAGGPAGEGCGFPGTIGESGELF